MTSIPRTTVNQQFDVRQATYAVSLCSKPGQGKLR